jgi:hypothetical protein
MINNLAADSAGEQVIRNSLEDFLVAVLVKAVKNIFMSFTVNLFCHDPKNKSLSYG